ncbi:hypothetical protein KC19_5G169300 [Ceratodon purpureus]|uniref:Secreted protein n=1 Tax=Ceratodon purpureus TaxID=3225 RepID=A0A8T0I4G9_CERPU|nr:hypothetical protein KC19_5G169300 [Ceratodon purpureus]
MFGESRGLRSWRSALLCSALLYPCPPVPPPPSSCLSVGVDGDGAPTVAAIKANLKPQASASTHIHKLTHMHCTHTTTSSTARFSSANP